MTDFESAYVPFSEPLNLSELSQALNTLTPDQRSAIWLRYVSDMSLEEVAQVMEKSPDAVAALTHRAIKQLRKTLSA